MRRFAIPAFLVLVTLSLSCGKGSSNSPYSPGLSPDKSASEYDGQRFLWGYYEMAFDPVSSQMEIVPLRETAFHANVVQFLQAPYPLGIGVAIDSTDKIGQGELDVTVSITHPFDDPYYTGFDVRGIFIGLGTSKSTYDTSLTYAAPSEARLLNADGYTRWWNPVEFPIPGLLGFTPGALGNNTTFTTKLNPFKVFADHLGPQSEYVIPPGSRNEFTTTMKTNSRQYKLRFPLLGGIAQIKYNYAVDASWVDPVGDPTDLNSFPLDANIPEPYQITVADTGSTAFYDPGSGLFGGDLKLQIGVSRHGGEINVSWAAEELTKIVVESDNLFSPPIEIDPAGPHTSVEDHVLYDILIPDVTPVSYANQDLLIHAETNLGNYAQEFGSIAPGKPVTAYHIVEAPIIAGIPAPDPPDISVEVTRTSSGKLDGFIVDWEPVPDAVEYLVYTSDDPYEFNGPMVFTPTPDSPTTDTSWSFSTVGTDLSGQWMIYVTSRGMVGNPDSDSEPSNNALVDFVSFDSAGNPEGENIWRRRYTLTRGRFLQVSGSSLGVDNTGCALVSPNNFFVDETTCYIVSPELPDISSASQCYFELAHKQATDWPSGWGYSIGSADTIINPGVEDTNLKPPPDLDPPFPFPDSEWVYAYEFDLIDSSADYLSGYQMTMTDVYGLNKRFNQPFDPGNELGDPTDGWGGNLTSSAQFYVSRYSIPNVIDNAHKHAGVGVGGRDPTVLNPSNQFPLVVDEFALVIY
ncbi:MAG TPA: hypothetical protein VGB30_03150 [bacterium]|jgi:hypothetical protein